MDTNQAYSVTQFCQQHNISRALFYRAKKEGWAPKTMAVGRRTLVSHESAAAWRKQREAETVV